MPKGKVKTNRAKVRRRLQKQRKRRREVEKIKDAKENVLHESSQSEHLSDTPATASATLSCSTELLPFDDTVATRDQPDTSTDIIAEKQADGYSTDDFWKALDNRSEEFWKRYFMSVKDIPSDSHSAIIIGPHNLKVTVQCDNPLSPLKKICYQEFIQKIEERDQKLIATIRLLRDRCEILEEDVANSKDEVRCAYKQANQSIQRIREFWRNKIYEGQTRSGRMLMTSIRSRSQEKL